METLHKKNIQLINNYLHQIDELARTFFDTDLYSFDELKKIFNKSPQSWRIYQRKAEVQGYIHVSAIKKNIGDKLLNGEISECDIKLDDFLEDDNYLEGYIYIGSVVLKDNPTRDESLAVLIAGVVDRILELQDLNPKLSKIITIAVKNSKGVNHFHKHLESFGFEKKHIFKNSDVMFFLDLNNNNNNRRFSNLRTLVARKRIEYYQNKKIKKIIFIKLKKIFKFALKSNGNFLLKIISLFRKQI